MPDGCDAALYNNILQKYEDKAQVVQAESQARRAALSSERHDYARQQQEVKQSLDECHARLSSAKDKGKLFKGSATGEMADVVRQEAKLQNRAGFLDGKLSRLDDQLLRTSTELKANIDKLERERASEIETLGDDCGLESSM